LNICPNYFLKRKACAPRAHFGMPLKYGGTNPLYPFPIDPTLLSPRFLSVCVLLVPISLYLFSCALWLSFLFLFSSLSLSIPGFVLGSLPKLQCHFVLVSHSHFKSWVSILL
jgi:hypothetical protein